MGGSPPYALTPVQYRDWAGAEDETMFNKKKQLLPKDLADRAEKVDPAKVEAEVLRIISAKPAPLSPMDPHFVRPLPGQLVDSAQWGQFLQGQAAGLQQLQQWAGNMGGGLGNMGAGLTGKDPWAF
jgi:hypothetical protein